MINGNTEEVIRNCFNQQVSPDYQSIGFTFHEPPASQSVDIYQLPLVTRYLLLEILKLNNSLEEIQSDLNKLNRGNGNYRLKDYVRQHLELQLKAIQELFMSLVRSYLLEKGVEDYHAYTLQLYSDWQFTLIPQASASRRPPSCERPPIIGFSNAQAN
jgi:hypothetical protein